MGKFMTLYTELGSVKYFKVSFSHGRVIFFCRLVDLFYNMFDFNVISRPWNC